MINNLTNKNRICCVIPSLQAGGMERVMSELINYFSSDENQEVHLILYGKERGIFYSIPGNVTVYKPTFEFDDKHRIKNTLKTILFLRKQIKDISPSTILSFGEYWNSMLLLSLYALKYKIFISDRCQPDKKYGRLHSMLRKWLYPRAYGIIVQTEFAKKTYLNHFNHPNIHVIGNPIKQINNYSINIKQENIILSVGRLISTKNHDILIKIFSKLNITDWKLVIVGGDSIKQKNSFKLKKMIADLNMEESILLLGEQNKIEEYYLKSKIFAFTSSSEGFPNVIGEAMSAGLPVVAFDCIAGPSEMIIDGTNGYLVPVFDENSFMEKLNILIQDPILRKNMSLQAKKSILEFKSEIIAEKYLSLITKV